MRITAGALCAGYGGLEIGLSQALDLDLRWVSEIEHYPSQVLAYHFPGVPNLGDLKEIRDPEPVTMLTGGYPCQPFSIAGRGLAHEDPRHLWPWIRDMVENMGPRYVVFENVRMHVKRGLFEVLQDLMNLGYTVHYYVLSAAQAGAAHRRDRVFIFGSRATGKPPSGEPVIVDGEMVDGKALALPKIAGVARDGLIFEGVPAALTAPTSPLLPTPAVNDMGEGKTVEKWDAWTERMRALHGNGNGHGKSLAIEALRLSGAVEECRFGIYSAAVKRSEWFQERTAPEPTEVGAQGNPRLSTRFVEWLMMLPEGWVTDPQIWEGATDARGRALTGWRGAGTIRRAQLKMLGNGVVPDQATLATQSWLRDTGLRP